MKREITIADHWNGVEIKLTIELSQIKGIEQNEVEPFASRLGARIEEAADALEWDVDKDDTPAEYILLHTLAQRLQSDDD